MGSGQGVVPLGQSGCTTKQEWGGVVPNMSYRSKSLVLLLGGFVFALSAPAAFGGVIHGFADFSLGAWDFSAQITVGPFTPDADLYFAFVVDPPLGDWIAAVNGAMIAMVDSSFGELTTAPVDTSLYDYDMAAILGITYVIRTGEGHYAKFTVDQLYPLIVLEYVYQPNGSPMLVDPVGVEQTTWGRVKAIYR